MLIPSEHCFESYNICYVFDFFPHIRNNVFSAGVPPISTIVMNASSEVPMITMRILNENHQDAVVTKLGERLTLRIEIKPADGMSSVKYLIIVNLINHSYRSFFSLSLSDSFFKREIKHDRI